MSAEVKITDEMVERAYDAYHGNGSAGRYAIRHALEAALNPPPVLCKNCGKPKDEHVWPTYYARSPQCPGTVWETNDKAESAPTWRVLG